MSECETEHEDTSTINDKVPYHGAEELNTAVRKMIFETPDGAMKPMSSNLMMKTLIAEGMKEGMASKLNSQIRKGAPLHVAWKSAFSTGKFIQKTGRGAGSRKKRTHEETAMMMTTQYPSPMMRYHLDGANQLSSQLQLQVDHRSGPHPYAPQPFTYNPEKFARYQFGGDNSGSDTDVSVSSMKHNNHYPPQHSSNFFAPTPMSMANHHSQHPYYPYPQHTNSDYFHGMTCSSVPVAPPIASYNMMGQPPAFNNGLAQPSPHFPKTAFNAYGERILASDSQSAYQPSHKVLSSGQSDQINTNVKKTVAAVAVQNSSEEIQDGISELSSDHTDSLSEKSEEEGETDPFSPSLAVPENTLGAKQGGYSSPGPTRDTLPEKQYVDMSRDRLEQIYYRQQQQQQQQQQLYYHHHQQQYHPRHHQQFFEQRAYFEDRPIRQPSARQGVVPAQSQIALPVSAAVRPSSPPPPPQQQHKKQEVVAVEKATPAVCSDVDDAVNTLLMLGR